MPDFTTNTFKVGDRVTIHTGQSGPQSLATVDRFTHAGRCMVLSDGSEWRADGKRQWSFRGSFYKGPFVQPTRDEDVRHVAKRRAIGAIHKWADGLNLETPLSDEALRRILDVIETEKAAVQCMRED